MMYVKIFYTGEKVMFEVGQKYKIYRNSATEIREKDWVNAVVESVPDHGRFVRMRLHFTGRFVGHTSYVESYSVAELEKMIKNGELVKR